MKYLKLLSLCLVICSITCCNKDDDSDVNNMGSDDCTISFTVNGTASSEDLNGCVLLGSTLNLGSASTTQANTILQIDPISDTGTFTVDDGSVTLILVLPDGTQIGALEASINVTEFSNSKTKGTFSGTFYDLMDFSQSPDFNVTNGSFDASF